MTIAYMECLSNATTPAEVPPYQIGGSNVQVIPGAMNGTGYPPDMPEFLERIVPRGALERLPPYNLWSPEARGADYSGCSPFFKLRLAAAGHTPSAPPPWMRCGALDEAAMQRSSLCGCAAPEKTRR